MAASTLRRYLQALGGVAFVLVGVGAFAVGATTPTVFGSRAMFAGVFAVLVGALLLFRSVFLGGL